MELYAPAKVNLNLEITGKRPDGYHSLTTIMQTVTLFDRITLKRNTAHRIRLACDGLPDTPEEENLAFRAAARFYRQLGVSAGVDIHLQKKIPVAAGLGGGSSDAAAVIRGLNILHGKPFSRKVLQEITGGLGSDVPFFISGGTALAQGRGDSITPLPFIGRLLILLINPGFPVSTARVYSSMKLDLTTPRRLHNILPALSKGCISAEELSAAVHNDLQPTVMALFPEIDHLLQWLRSEGAGCAAVSGSGGTVFGVFFDSDAGKRAAQNARRRFPWSELVETADRHEDCY